MSNIPSRQIIQLLVLIGLLNIAGGLILPLVGPLFLNAKAGIIPGAIDINTRYVFYSEVLTAFAIGLCIGDIFWGYLSDHFGRKKTLIFCSIGLIISYCCCGLAILLQNFIFFAFGRLLTGLMSGSQTIAIAAIIDRSTPEVKPIYLSWVWLASCLGLLAGPLLGGLLLPVTELATFHFALPFFIVVIIICINLISLQIFYIDLPRNQIFVSLREFIQTFFAQFYQFGRLRWFIFGFLLSCFSWFLYYQYMALYLAHQLEYQPYQISYFMIAMVIIYFVTLLLIYPQLLKRAQLIHLVMGSLLVMSISIGSPLLLTQPWTVWLWSIPFVGASAILITTWMTLLSNQVRRISQGWIVGLSGTVYALGWLSAAPLVGLLGILGPQIPFAAACVSAFLSFSIIWCIKNKYTEQI